MIGALVRWLPLSLALHIALLAATLLLPRETTLQPLFVDLTLSPSRVESDTPPPARSGGRESPAPPRRQPAGREKASPPLAASRSVMTSVPAAPASPPAPEPPAPTAALPAPPPTAPPAAEPKPEPVVAPPPAPSPTAATSAPAPAAPDVTASTGGGGMAPGAAGGSSVGGGRETTTGPVGRAAEAGGASSRDAVNASAGGGGASGGEVLALGIPGDDGGAYAGYISLLRRRVQEALTYPATARRRGLSGTVHLDISVEPTGRIADVLVVHSSSHAMLDAAALDAVRALRQVPFPPGVRPRPVRVRLPVVFELR